VLCTTTIVGDVVSQVAGDRVTVDVLLPTHSDPHAFEMTPKDVVRIAQVDVLFVNGAGLEAFLSPFLADVSARIVDLSETVPLRDPAGAEAHTIDHGFDQTSNADPHVWFDPTNVMIWTDAIASTLAKLDPPGADEYARRAAAYKLALSNLDGWIRHEIQKIPAGNGRLVTDHASFGYFARRYGLEQIGTVFPGLGTLSEPSAREIAALEDAIVTFDIPTIFVGTTVNPSLAERIAGDTGVRVVFLYTGSLSDLDGPAPSYLELMRYDVDQIVGGLQTP
jgi:ABC-type Zn uptake system ZnuABC Zn-binding protein ZnuA